MLVLAGCLGVVLGLFGRRSRYGAPRAALLAIVVAALQLAAIPSDGRLRMVMLVSSALLAVVWLVWQRHLASLLLAIGAATNLFVIAINGGMPVDPQAVEAVGGSGVVVTEGRFYNHIPMDTGTKLSCLGDRIPIPIHRSVLSLGDVLMMAGTALWIADAVRGWRAGSSGCARRTAA